MADFRVLQGSTCVVATAMIGRSRGSVDASVGACSRKTPRASMLLLATKLNSDIAAVKRATFCSTALNLRCVSGAMPRRIITGSSCRRR